MTANVTKRALDFATAKHAGQTRKYTGEPYILHPIAVADIVRSTGTRDLVIAAALLHDVLEDTDTTVADLIAAFGDEIARLVIEVTDVSRPEDGSRAARKAIDRAHLARGSSDAHTIKLADVIDNVSSIVERDPEFAAVYVKEKAAVVDVLIRGDAGLLARARALLR